METRTPGSASGLGKGPRVIPTPRPRPTQPAGAVVVSVDEKSQRIPGVGSDPADCCRCAKAFPEQQTHDYIRHGTTSLFAALEVAHRQGHRPTPCYPRHTNVEFLAFLKLGRPQGPPPACGLCLICDNYATHTHPRVTAWLDKNPRVTLHFTPTSCSWLNMVEIFFGIITRQAIRRGTFTDVAELQTAIRTYIDSYNERATPFSWTKTAEELLGKIKRKSINNTRH